MSHLMGNYRNDSMAAWRTDCGVLGIRPLVQQRISEIFLQQKGGWDSRMPRGVMTMDNILFVNAASEEEYCDPSTLETRLQRVMSDVGEHTWAKNMSSTSSSPIDVTGTVGHQQGFSLHAFSGGSPFEPSFREANVGLSNLSESFPSQSLHGYENKVERKCTWHSDVFVDTSEVFHGAPFKTQKCAPFKSKKCAPHFSHQNQSQQVGVLTTGMKSTVVQGHFDTLLSSQSIQPLSPSEGCSSITSISYGSAGSPSGARNTTSESSLQARHKFFHACVHSLNCSAPEGECKDIYCKRMKEIIQHSNLCRDYSCRSFRCYEYRELIACYRNYSHSSCLLCKPVSSTQDSRKRLCGTGIVVDAEEIQKLPRKRMKVDHPSPASVTWQNSPPFTEKVQSSEVEMAEEVRVDLYPSASHSSCLLCKPVSSTQDSRKWLCGTGIIVDAEEIQKLPLKRMKVDHPSPASVTWQNSPPFTEKVQSSEVEMAEEVRVDLYPSAAEQRPRKSIQIVYDIYCGVKENPSPKDEISQVSPLFVNHLQSSDSLMPGKECSAHPLGKVLMKSVQVIDAVDKKQDVLDTLKQFHKICAGELDGNMEPPGTCIRGNLVNIDGSPAKENNMNLEIESDQDCPMLIDEVTKISQGSPLFVNHLQSSDSLMPGKKCSAHPLGKVLMKSVQVIDVVNKEQDVLDTLKQYHKICAGKLDRNTEPPGTCIRGNPVNIDGSPAKENNMNLEIESDQDRPMLKDEVAEISQGSLLFVNHLQSFDSLMPGKECSAHPLGKVQMKSVQVIDAVDNDQDVLDTLKQFHKICAGELDRNMEPPGTCIRGNLVNIYGSPAKENNMNLEIESDQDCPMLKDEVTGISQGSLLFVNHLQSSDYLMPGKECSSHPLGKVLMKSVQVIDAVDKEQDALDTMKEVHKRENNMNLEIESDQDCPMLKDEVKEISQGSPLFVSHLQSSDSLMPGKECSSHPLGKVLMKSVQVIDAVDKEQDVLDTMKEVHKIGAGELDRNMEPPVTCIRGNPVNIDGSSAKENNMNLEIESDQDCSMLKHEVTEPSLHPAKNSVSASLKVVAMTELFVPEQIKEHVESLRNWTGECKAKAEKFNALGQVVNENSCKLCRVETLMFEPPAIYCSLCFAQIKRNAVYHVKPAENSSMKEASKPTFCFCNHCYTEFRNESFKVDGIAVDKYKFKRRKNDEAFEEPWVQCDKCEGWQHEICALFNSENNQGGAAEYTCPICSMKEIESGSRKPLPESSVLGAKDLPKSFLSDHIEKRLAQRLRKDQKLRAKASGKKFNEVPAAENLVVRVVSSIDKILEVSPKFRDIFPKGSYPSEFPFKSKAIVLFQKIQGVEVLLMAMYVQEFGSECASPNQRHVYVSYIDSVKYFLPDISAASGEALRTFVYHEILIGYLDYVKNRGFANCYIWACPPLKGNDYIFNCHPEIQKIPKFDKLKDWYRALFQKALKEEIVVKLTNLYDHIFMSTGECKAKVTSARLPYFDGDFLPGAIEDTIDSIQDNKDGTKRLKKPRKKINKRALKAAAMADRTGDSMTDILLMQTLGETIYPVQDGCILANLQPTCTCCCQFLSSGRHWDCTHCKDFHLCANCHEAENEIPEKHTLKEVVDNVPEETKDKDRNIQNCFVDNRNSFLEFCQENFLQFNTLRRAKHSSMMILHKLHM